MEAKLHLKWNRLASESKHLTTYAYFAHNFINKLINSIN